MEFDIRKPSHIFALLLISLPFLFFMVFPITSNLFGIPYSGQIDQPIQIPEFARTTFELIMLIIQMVLVIGLFIIVPFLWYLLVNRCKTKEIFSRINLRMEGIDTAFLWGILAGISAMVITIIISALLAVINPDLIKDASNIPYLEMYFSIPSMVFIIFFQSISEEIFFRGFLLEKIDSFAGKNIAIFGTAVLFGLFHISYWMVYPVLMPMIIGIIFGFVVVKTKNLVSAITAHMLFNLASFVLYLFAESLGIEALIL